MASLLTILGQFLASLFGQWISQEDHNNAEQQLGAQAAEVNADDKAVAVVEARSNVVPLTADELSKHNASNDPDFRD